MRSRNRHRFVVLLSSLAVIMGLSAASGEEASEFARRHALIKPQPDEDRWMQVPWVNSLWEARKKAAAEGKPILLWEMDGHPLGCT